MVGVNSKNKKNDSHNSGQIHTIYYHILLLKSSKGCSYVTVCSSIYTHTHHTSFIATSTIAIAIAAGPFNPDSV